MKANLVNLSDVAEFINGVAFKPEDWVEFGMPIVRIQNLNDPNKPYNYTNRKVNENNIVRNGDLLVSWSASLGVFEWAGNDAYVNQHIFKVLPNGKVDKKYLKRALEASIEKMEAQVHGATMKHITRGKFLAIQIPLPPLDEQRRIAAILDKADELRQKRRQAIAKLDELVQATFIDMFGDPVTNPKGWDTKPLVNLVDFKGGGTPSRANSQYWDGPIPWITVKDFKEKIFIDSAAEHITELGVKNSATNIIKSGTIIMPTRMGLGKFAITQVDAAINQDLKALTLKDESLITNDYLIFFLISQKQRIISLGKGATVKGVTLNDLYPISVAIPPMQLQKKWADFFSKSRNQKDSLNTQIKQMETLFQSLQHQAFNGELT